ncbi:TTL domain-containing protein [Colletotrichum higginsianum]|uniref:TTL domain-containing protein n=2 Tax=Colletotrichum higginsianum TaxID=80884 RepID=H1VJJ2_COLHI|nr:TTL domain-containing protein [Colletotrichum higginsianum IMI 349063]OBR04639.1 TTL domain-containing protein [Colletotrichum higginsianum IMI 349063]TIC94166.1 putative tubulin--tyrosine ligase PBY1 [Colletotrichum higginsianum]CCF40395.1 TTL domain-containing protein [Colletotrichum higginsianum]
MRLLLVNDDGPPSSVSPYFAPFVDALNEAGHTTVVVIPDRPLSWIGKAHAVGKTLTAASRCPASFADRTCDVPGCDDADDRTHRWLVVDGLPASCAQIGLFHAGFDPADFDLVVSGPNHGPNVSTVYALGSGTVGGAMEAAQCGRKAVALSFGSKDAQPGEVIRAACVRAAALVGDLARDWHPDVDVYSVNVPMVADIADRPVRLTTTARGRWVTGGLFSPAPADPEKLAASRVYQFRWAPQLADIKRQAEESPEGEDLWASLNGVISVAPLKASFTAVDVQK